MNPKVTPINKITGRHIERLNQSIELLLKHCAYPATFLSIGEPNLFDKEVAGGNEVVNTTGDLDLNWKPEKEGKFSRVLCFEVMEHLTNPLSFLRRLKKYTTSDSLVFVSIPNHLLRRHWRTLHFHEIDPVRFEYLCEKSGWKIVDRVCYKYWPKLSDITGVRPFIRYITGYSWFISRTDRWFYVLKHGK